MNILEEYYIPTHLLIDSILILDMVHSTVVYQILDLIRNRTQISIYL